MERGDGARGEAGPGLVHVSQLSRARTENASDVVAVRDRAFFSSPVPNVDFLKRSQRARNGRGLGG